VEKVLLVKLLLEQVPLLLVLRRRVPLSNFP
jgi:hypothetical protein